MSNWLTIIWPVDLNGDYRVADCFCRIQKAIYWWRFHKADPMSLSNWIDSSFDVNCQSNIFLERKEFHRHLHSFGYMRNSDHFPDNKSEVFRLVDEIDLLIKTSQSKREVTWKHLKSQELRLNPERKGIFWGIEWYRTEKKLIPNANLLK